MDRSRIDSPTDFLVEHYERDSLNRFTRDQLNATACRRLGLS